MSRNPVSDIRALRLDGKLPEALRAITAALGQHPANGDLLAEGVRVLLLSGQNDTAARLYQSLGSATTGARELEPEALVRLALQMNRRDLVEGMPIPEGPAWLVHLLREGSDPTTLWEIHEITVQLDGGQSVFTLRTSCPYCAHSGSHQVRTNLMQARSGLCPSCFGHGRLHFRGIGTFLQEHHADLLVRQDAGTDWEMIERVRPRLLELEEAPEILWGLGQDYQFLLNEIITRRLLSGEEERP